MGYGGGCGRGYAEGYRWTTVGVTMGVTAVATVGIMAEVTVGVKAGVTVISHCPEIVPQWTYKYEASHDLRELFWQPNISQRIPKLLPMQNKHKQCQTMV